MIENDYHLSTPCDAVNGGCGAMPGENCHPGCVTDDDHSLEDHVAEVDPDRHRDWIIDRELGII